MAKSGKNEFNPFDEWRGFEQHTQSDCSGCVVVSNKNSIKTSMTFTAYGDAGSRRAAAA